MCQLLALNSKNPASIRFAFTGFAERGGRTDAHTDGWGIAFFSGTGWRLFIEQQSSVESPVASYIKQYPLKSTNILAHIRKATQGEITLLNCHPFMRELWGQYWTFAHNGDLQDFQPALNGSYRPKGSTDSERAFCYLLDRLKARFPTQAPSDDELFASIASLSAEIAQFGRFNFLLSNGQYMIAHCSTHLHYVQRRYPFPRAKLIDCDLSIDFNEHNQPDDLMIIVATQPLTKNEAWQAFQPGELKVFKQGECVYSAFAYPQTEPAVGSDLRQVSA